MQDLKLQVINNSCRDERTCSCCAKDFFEERPPLWKRRKMINGSIAGALLAAGLFIRSMTPFDIASQIIFLSVIAVAGREILKKAWASIARLRLDMNCLMSIAAFGAFFIGHGEEGAAVIFLFYIAETLEDYAADNAKRSISQLLSLAPETARVKVDGQEKEIHTQEINTGDVVTVRPGEKVPLDGRVIHGHSSVNESAITGESAPAAKTEGDEVYAGTLNEEGYLEIEVTKRSGNTVLARIVRLVEEAERKKSKTEKHIDRFARIYTPVVIGLALAAFIVPVFIFGKPLDVWLYRALVLLVISCPCALAISTPVAMVSAISSASRHGVLIKGATFIEELSRIRAIAFDKTGTLTRGKFEVTDIVCFKGHSEKEVLSVAASIETRSGHPIARSIVKKAAEENVRLKEITGFQDIKGKGLRAQLNGKTYYAGAKNLFDALSVEIPGELAGFETEGRTTIFIADEDGAVGIIALGDRVRDRAPAIISLLKKLNIRTEMLTGDNQRVASALAGKTGIDEYHAGLLPEDKVKVIEKLTRKYHSVAMVGDGVNDAPALAAAGVGIAMGTAGSDVAIETADIALMHDDLSRIGYLVSLSRKTMFVVKQNIAVSIVIKASLTVMALLGLINLWVAVGIGDMGLSLAVILNALRLTKVKA